MPVISIYSTDSPTRQEICRLLNGLGEDHSALQVYCYEDFGAFLDSGRENPRRILLLAEKGTGGVELAVSIAEECPDNRFIWLSDLDFALFSYRLEVAYFGFLPAEPEALRLALRNCRKQKVGHAPPEAPPSVPQPPLFRRLLEKLEQAMGGEPF